MTHPSKATSISSGKKEILRLLALDLRIHPPPCLTGSLIAHNYPQRIEKAGGQMFHAACSCTFPVAHRSPELYFVHADEIAIWMAVLENVLKPVVKVVRLEQRQYASAPSTHTGLLCQRRVKAPVPEKIQTIAAVVLFASRGRGSSTCRLCDDCKWVTLQIAHNYPQRMEKAGGQMFHAACSCTFPVAHRSPELYFVTRTRLQYGWLRLKMC